MNKVILQNAKKVAGSISGLSHSKRQAVLRNLARELRRNVHNILTQNERDTKTFDRKNPMFDRLLLTERRVGQMARELDSLIRLPDPLVKFDSRMRHGLTMYRQRVPFGVIGIVYEARPNVTTDVVGVCIKSGNVVVLKGGQEGKHTYKILMRIINKALRKAHVSLDIVQMFDPEDRRGVMELIQAREYVDLVIPRGSKELISFVRENARVPVIETGAGVCHTFVDATANLKESALVVYNAKTQRPSVCNSLDTVLVHKNIAKDFLPQMAGYLAKDEVEIFADPRSYKILRKYPWVHKATKESFGKEFLSLAMSIKIVADVHGAVQHINTYSSGHSDAILTNRKVNKEYFIQSVDSAVVYTNASIRFTDGGIFGLGSEIGTSTQKLHARGPMGPTELTTYKWIVSGKYTTRN